MSIINAINETQHENNNLKELAKLPQYLIMNMVQRGDIEEYMLTPILGMKAEMADEAAKMQAAQQLAAQGGALPTILEQDMAKVAQAENPAPPMPQQEMQQPMPQQMAQAPMAQGPEDVGIASQATAPMQMAGGGIIAFESGGMPEDDDEEDDRYDQYRKKARRSADYADIYEGIAGLKGSGGSGAGYSGSGLNPTPRTEGGDLESRLRAAIMSKESGGKRYDKNGNLLTSSKGAQGEMQVMPGTARDPGFGIKAARDNSPDELRRVGDEYSNMLLSRYKDPKLAMIAYNMGPGATDKWLAKGADISKLPKETQGYIRGVNLAGGGEVRHYDVGGEIDTIGAELDALRAGAKTLEEQLMSGGSRGGAKTPELQAAYDNAVRLRKQKEIEYEALMNKAGVNKPSFFPQSSLSTKRPEPNPIVKREATGAPPIAKPTTSVPSGAAPVQPPPAARNEIPQSPEGIKALQEKVDDENFNVMQYIKEQQAERKEAAKQDKWQAGLAAGLGMLGGTSQHAWENIGKGGQMGVQQLAQSQKLRAAENKAAGELYSDAARMDLASKTRKDALAQAGSTKYGAEVDKINTARTNLEKKYLDSPKYMQLATMPQLLAKLRKDPNNKELVAQYNSLQELQRDLENKVRRDLPDPNPTLYGVSGSGGGGYTPTKSQSAAFNKYS